MVFDRGSAADVDGGCECRLLAPISKRAAVVAEEVAGETAADDGADLAAGFGVDTGDADEVGVSCG